MKLSDAVYLCRRYSALGSAPSAWRAFHSKVDTLKARLLSGAGEAFCVLSGDSGMLYGRKSDAVRAARHLRDVKGLSGVSIKRVTL
jgi:hypothetical protein